MRKSLIALCVAGALTAPMIAQADANLLMAQPALFFQFEVSQAQPVTLTAEVSAIESRMPGLQPEAVVIMASKSRQWPDGPGVSETADYRPGYASPAAGPFERGWQS
jgi:hypothetical protein